MKVMIVETNADINHKNNNNNKYYIDRRIHLNLFQINSKRRMAQRFEACCQWALLNVQIIILLFKLKVHAGVYCISVNHRTLTWTTGFNLRT